MIRLGSIFWLILVTVTVFAVYAVKYEVQGLEDELAHTRKATISADREIRVLEAEWAYQNRPSTLARLNERFLSLAPIATKQLQTAITDIPLRPPPAAAAQIAAAAPPGPQVAAAAPAAPVPAPVRSASAAAAAAQSLDQLIDRVAAGR